VTHEAAKLTAKPASILLDNLDRVSCNAFVFQSTSHLDSPKDHEIVMREVRGSSWLGPSLKFGKW